MISHSPSRIKVLSPSIAAAQERQREIQALQQQAQSRQQQQQLGRWR